MPGKNRKEKRRPLWTNIKFKVPKRTPKWKVKETLIRSIENAEEGEYELPDGWDVILEWRNKYDAPMKSGIWAEEMTASAQSSPGFDVAMLAQLEKCNVEPKPKKRRKKKLAKLQRAKGRGRKKARKRKVVLVRGKRKRVNARPGSRPRPKTRKAPKRIRKVKGRGRRRKTRRA